jgi:hypothetical protein
VSYYYKKAAAGQQVTVRASRPKFHSTATFVCPVAPAAVKPAAVSQEQASQPLEIAILHNKLNQVSATDCCHNCKSITGVFCLAWCEEATSKCWQQQWQPLLDMAVAAKDWCTYKPCWRFCTQVLATDSTMSTMRVGAGMTVGELLNAATKARMSVQVSACCLKRTVVKLQEHDWLMSTHHLQLRSSCEALQLPVSHLVMIT